MHRVSPRSVAGLDERGRDLAKVVRDTGGGACLTRATGHLVENVLASPGMVRGGPRAPRCAVPHLGEREVARGREVLPDRGARTRGGARNPEQRAGERFSWIRGALHGPRGPVPPFRERHLLEGAVAEVITDRFARPRPRARDCRNCDGTSSGGGRSSLR